MREEFNTAHRSHVPLVQAATERPRIFLLVLLVGILPSALVCLFMALILPGAPVGSAQPEMARPNTRFITDPISPTVLNVQGGGFAPGERVSVYAARSQDAPKVDWIELASVTAVAEGSFRVDGVDVTTRLPAERDYVLIAWGANSGTEAVAGGFRTLAPAPIFVPTVPPPTLAPTLIPTSIPTPTPVNACQADYFSDRDFRFVAESRAEVAPIRHYWGAVAPFTSLSVGNFSAKFTCTLFMTQTTSYLFDLQVDGAARVKLNGQTIIDQFFIGKSRHAFATEPVVIGQNVIEVEYYNTKGTALLCLDWLPKVFTGWAGRYYANSAFAGAPVFIRDDENINFPWGWDGPGSTLPADGFSVIWERKVQLPATGDYKFSVAADDGFRVVIDGQVIEGLDRLGVGPNSAEVAVRLRAGKHFVQVQYTEYNGTAGITFRYDFITPPPATVSPPILCQSPDCH